MALAPIIASRFTDEDLDGLAKAQLIALIVILVIFGWMGLARLIRGQVLSLREREFIQAAEVIGVPTRQILFKELLPNLVAPIVVSISLGAAGVRRRRGRPVLPRARPDRSARRWGRWSPTRTTYYADYPLYLWAACRHHHAPDARPQPPR